MIFCTFKIKSNHKTVTYVHRVRGLRRSQFILSDDKWLMVNITKSIYNSAWQQPLQGKPRLLKTQLELALLDAFGNGNFTGIQMCRQIIKYIWWRIFTWLRRNEINYREHRGQPDEGYVSNPRQDGGDTRPRFGSSGINFSVSMSFSTDVLIH